MTNTASTSRLLEICVESYEDAVIAVKAGADRIEYCSALALGGLTPTVGAMMRMGEIAAPCMVMIRPVPGNFVYDADMVAIMKREIAFARDHGAAGVVLGAAKPDQTLDRDVLADLMAAADGLQTTLHRVFDAVPDPFVALETAIDLGFDRILTSGQQPTAQQGAGVIADLVTQAAGRIAILPGSGVSAENAAGLLRMTGANELHASCKAALPRPVEAEYAGRVQVDKAAVMRLKAMLDGANAD